MKNVVDILEELLAGRILLSEIINKEYGEFP